jgi:hypothetical protein
MQLNFAGALLLIFITLKLTGVVDWSWWWVMSPLWITVVIAIVALVVWVSFEHFSGLKDRKRADDAVRRLPKP